MLQLIDPLASVCMFDSIQIHLLTHQEILSIMKSLFLSSQSVSGSLISDSLDQPADNFLGRLARSLQSAMFNGLSAAQHLVMRVAVAASLKLCIFTARVLLGSRGGSQQTSQSF